MGPFFTAPSGKGAVKDVKAKKPSPRVWDGLRNPYAV